MIMMMKNIMKTNFVITAIAVVLYAVQIVVFY